MGTIRLERRTDNERIQNRIAHDETMLSMRNSAMEEEVNVISDDECDVGARTSTSRTSVRTFSHVAAHREDVSTPTSAVCDSCQFCNDVCDIPNCVQCQSKAMLPQAPRSYTMCQIRRHNNIDQSVWIVADDTVYDVTSYIQHHPGGMECILKKAGGKHNCRRDLQFHSQRGQQLFNKYAIGKVVVCPGCVVASDSSSGNLNGSNTNTTTTSRPSMLAALEKHRWFLW